MRAIKSIVLSFILCLSAIVIYCEFILYYKTLLKCNWPILTKPDVNMKPIKAMMVADTHMLGPRQGHWLDQLRREWQMHRSFQSAITLFRPEYVFILGDIFDEGKWVNNREFEAYMLRFRRIFAVPETVKLHTMAGNHDVGFHYATHPFLVNRFNEAFNSTPISLLSVRGVHFVMINSIAMEGDGCNICENAEYELLAISKRLKCSRGIGRCANIPKLDEAYSKPIILQHYPMYRESDKLCREHDSPTIDIYRERWEVLSKESTDLIGELTEPRLAFSGHSHHYCHLLTNRLSIEEFTVPSFNWRNKLNPSFLLATITSKNHAVEKCNLPLESAIQNSYLVGIILSILIVWFRNVLARMGWKCVRMIRGQRTQYKEMEH